MNELLTFFLSDHFNNCSRNQSTLVVFNQCLKSHFSYKYLDFNSAEQPLANVLEVTVALHSS